MPSFLEKDVHLHVNNLPAVQLGFEPDEEEDADDSSIRLSPVNESMDDDIANNHDVVRQSSMGVDYHKELDHLHKNYKHPDNISDQDKVADSLAYDVLKKGKDLGTDNTNLLANSVDYLEHGPVNRKYDKFISTHIAKKHLDADTLDKSIMTPEEINSVPLGWKHVGMRVFAHNGSGIHAEHHPVHGLQIVQHPDIHRLNKVAETIATEHKTFKTHDDLIEHTGINSTGRLMSLQRYTDDSAHLNKYLALAHMGKERDYKHILGHPVERVESEVGDIDSEFSTAHHYAVHGKPLSVYTGVYGEHNILTQSTKDEHGNIYFKNPSYTSTSLDLHTADGFAKNKSLSAADPTIHRGVREIVSLRVPEWYPHARYLGGISSHQSEKELLLNRGQVFKIHPAPIHLALSDRMASTRIWSGHVVPHDSEADKPFEEKSHVNKVIHMMTNPTFDKDKLWKLANEHTNTGVRTAAAYHPNFPTERVADFLDHDHDVRSTLLARKHLPEHIIDHAINNQNTKELRILARRNNLAPHHFDKLFETQYPSVHAELAHRADLNDSQVNKLYEAGQTDLQTLRAIAMHPKIGGQRIDMLANHPDTGVKISVARNTSTPREVLKRMYGNSNSYLVDGEIITSPNFWNFKETK